MASKNGRKKPKRPLTRRQDTFCQIIALDPTDNGTRAAQDAGYKGSNTALRVIAHKLLTRANIQARIVKLRDDNDRKAGNHIMSSYQVLAGMSQIAECSIADVVNAKGQLDLKKAIKSGADKFIKAITYHKDGSIRGVILHDSLKARDIMGRYYKLWERGDRPIDDPEAVLEYLLKISRKQLPPADFVEGEVVHDIPEESLVSKKSQ